MRFYPILLFLSLTIFSCTKKKSASCSDGILNQNEIRTDCGGDCAPCATCFDGIQNQDETGKDCGGTCQPCASENEKITYPTFGLHGHNILREDTITIKVAESTNATENA